MASFERRVDVWDTTTGRLLHTLPHPGALVLGVAFSRDGLLASVGEDKVVRVWDATGRQLLALRGHTATCGCVAFSPDGLRLASAGSDGTVPIWDATPLRGGERQESASFEEHGDEVWSVALNPVGPGIVSGGSNSPALVWDAETSRVRARFTGHGVFIFCLAWHPDGRRIASAGSADGQFSLKIWDATTGADVLTPQPPSRVEFMAAAFSPDGRYLVTGRRDRTVHVWDANDGQSIRPLGTHDGPLRAVVFSPRPPSPGDGQRRRGGQAVGRDTTRREAGGAKTAADCSRAFTRGGCERGLQLRPRGPVGRLGGRGQHREGLGQQHRSVGPHVSGTHRARHHLPAVQKVREAAARTKCANNLKQLGLAAQSYHDVQHHFPPGIGYHPFVANGTFGTYFFHLLPYIEQDNLFRSSLGTAPFSSPVGATTLYYPGNNGVYSRSVPGFLCPSDPGVGPGEPC